MNVNAILKAIIAVLIGAIVAMAILALGGCTTAPAVRITDTGCTWTKPLIVTVAARAPGAVETAENKYDTDETVREAIALHKAYVSNCAVKK